VGRAPYDFLPGSSIEILDSEATQLPNSTKRQLSASAIKDPRSGYVYFEVALSDNQDQTYQDTLASEDVIVLAVAITLYSIAILICIIFIIIDFRNNNQQLITWIKPVCILLSVAFIFRLAYAGYLFNDPQNDRITVLFIELPCQIFWTIAALLLLRWLKPRKECALSCKCCMGSLREFIMVIVVLNLGLFIVYLGMLFGINGDPVDSSPLLYLQRMISFVWFSWYVTYCMIALIWFIVATIAAFCECISGAFSDKSKLVKRAILISLIVAVMVFVGQTSVQIRTFLWVDDSPFPELRNWSIYLFFTQLMVVDLIPTILILYSAGTSSVGGNNFSPFKTVDTTDSQL